MYLQLYLGISLAPLGQLVALDFLWGCTLKMMKYQLPGRCFAFLMTTKTKPKYAERKPKKNGTENNKLLCGCWPSLVPLPPSLSPSVSLNLSLSISICVPVSFPACLRRLGLIFDSSIINHTLTFHTVRTASKPLLLLLQLLLQLLSRTLATY